LLLHLLLVYRLTNSIMMHGRNNGKKLMAVSSWLGF
jgi:ribosomal protein S7